MQNVLEPFVRVCERAMDRQLCRDNRRSDVCEAWSLKSEDNSDERKGRTMRTGNEDALQFAVLPDVKVSQGAVGFVAALSADCHS